MSASIFLTIPHYFLWRHVNLLHISTGTPCVVRFLSFFSFQDSHTQKLKKFFIFFFKFYLGLKEKTCSLKLLLTASYQYATEHIYTLLFTCSCFLVNPLLQQHVCVQLLPASASRLQHVGWQCLLQFSTRIWLFTKSNKHVPQADHAAAEQEIAF